MKLVDTIILSLTVVIFIIGVHQTFTVGLMYSYWIFMFSIVLLLILKYRKSKRRVVDPGKSKNKV